MTQTTVTTTGRPVTSLSVVQVEGWPTRKRAGEMLGFSIAQIRRWEQKGKLHAVSDANGVWRFNPEELEALADELGLNDDENGANGRANAYARVDLVNSIRLLRTVTGPQEQIHQRMSQLLDRQTAENERLRERIQKLEDELDRQRRVVQDAEDRVCERDALKMMVEAKEKRATEIVTRLIEHGGKFLNGGGTPFLHSLSEKQAAMLWSVLDDFAPHQQETIRDAVKKLGFDPTKWGSVSKVPAGGEPAPPGPGAEGAVREAPGGAGAEGARGAQSATT